MKIIKKEDTSDWKYLHTCVGCDSELEVDKLDVIYNPNFIDEKFDTKCIVCSTRFSIKEKDISKLVKIEIINYHNKKNKKNKSEDEFRYVVTDMKY